MKIVDKLVAASKNPPSPRSRFVARVLPVFVFFFFFPALLFIIPSLVLDRWLQLPTLHSFPIRIIPGGVLIALGLFFLVSSTKAQREIGKGTPMPLKATHKLVVEKPYSYCRNPLYFGLVNFFMGISIMIGSLSSLVMVLIFSAIILSYTKLIEEKELEKRYGNDYLEYKEATPLFIPRLSLFWRYKK
jgi:protein-S-isoprenylcysteine O-methyltransferase Ste14